MSPDQDLFFLNEGFCSLIELYIFISRSECENLKCYQLSQGSSLCSDCSVLVADQITFPAVDQAV